MITAIRAMFSSTIGKFLALAFVVLVGIAFALSDVTGNSAFGGMGGANVAKVGSENIGVGELRDRVRQTFDQARQDQPGLTMAAFIPASPFAPTADPGDAALQTFLSQNKTKFTVPERRVIQYALFDSGAVPVPAVTDAEIA